MLEQVSKKVVSRQHFDSLRVILLGVGIGTLEKYQDLRKNAALPTLFVMDVYKSIKIESLRKEF